MKKKQWLFIGVIFSLVSAFSACYFYLFLTSPIWQHKPSAPVIISFPEGATARSLTNIINKQQSVNCQACLSWYFRLLPEARQLQAGVYALAPTVTPKQLIDQLLNGQVLEQKLTITEGQTAAAVIENLSDLSIAPLSQDLSNQLAAHCNFCQQGIEGALLADTYLFLAGTEPIDILLRSHQALLKQLAPLWQQARANKLPYHSPYELLIAASIIEKETALKKEKPLISAVIVNRLRKKMRLQMDPTVIYGLGSKYQFPLKKADLKIQSPYNTYLNFGLPPTPICNVGIDALVAAANPADVDYLYFVATNMGNHHFSTTLESQNNAVRRFLNGAKDE